MALHLQEPFAVFSSLSLAQIFSQFNVWRLFFFFSSCCFRELSVLLCLSCLGVVRLPAQNSWAPPVTWLKRSLALTSSNAPLSFPPISCPVSCFADDALPSTHLNLLCLRLQLQLSRSIAARLLNHCTRGVRCDPKISPLWKQSKNKMSLSE